MTKSKAQVGMPVAFKVTRNESGVATNLFEHLAAKRNQAKRMKDNLKDHQQYTNGCLICKEFSKYRSCCPKCNGRMICFGNKVKNPKKGSKTEWREFIKAYAPRIYSVCSELLPCPEYEQQYQQELLNGSVYYGVALQRNQNRHEILMKWVVQFDKLLDEKYRK